MFGKALLSHSICGSVNIHLVGFETDILSSRMIGSGNLNDKLGDFGAEQVILVRDNETKAERKSCMGDSAFILTILESKGMEFDDVVLYNFFCGSSHHASSRCLHLLLDAEAASFDATKHAVSFCDFFIFSIRRFNHKS